MRCQLSLHCGALCWSLVSSFAFSFPIVSSSARQASLRMQSSESSQNQPETDRLQETTSSLLGLSHESPSIRASFERFQTTVSSLAEYEGEENVRLVKNEDVPEEAVVAVNSIVVKVSNLAEPVLVVLPCSSRIDLDKLETYLEDGNDDDNERISVTLAPCEALEGLCGFTAGTIPPLGHNPKSLRTIVDLSLMDNDYYENGNPLLKGGGGHSECSCLVRIQTLLSLVHTELGDVAVDDNEDQDEDNGCDVLAREQQGGTKAFFPAEPPSVEEAQLLVNDPDLENNLRPTDVMFVGRVNGVRRMSKRLVFVDIAPPDFRGSGTKQDCYELPWRCGTEGQDMAVQLIAGKTICTNLGDAEGQKALRRFKPGQLVLVRGRTNVASRSSLAHWVDKRSLDVVVSSYEILESSNRPARTDNPPPLLIKKETITSQRTSELRRLQVSSAMQADKETQDYLTTKDLLGEEGRVVVVDGVESVEEFSSQLAKFLENAPADDRVEGVVGLDCEWKPSFLLASPQERQPVLLLQVSLQPIKTVFLFDLQTLLRPCRQPTETMNEVETQVSKALTVLFTSKQLLKIGFHLVTDLRRLTSSYPHVEAFRMYHSIAEVGSIAKKSLQLAKIRNSKQAAMSLVKLTRYLMKKPMSKEQQISDWSLRPLTSAQIEYAALDAAVTPALFQKALDFVKAGWIEGSLQFGRWADDPSFDKAITSVRFMFLDGEDATTIRKLKAKSAVGSPYVVTQTWVTGSTSPQLPSAPADFGSGPYTDVNGVRRIPSLIVNLNQEVTLSTSAEIVGKRLGKSKDRCLEALLAQNSGLPEGAKLEYHHRSGYVEFHDGVALFVNMPKKIGGRAYGGYPNQWLDDGRSMSWFLRENEWKDGKSELGQKLLGIPKVNGNGPGADPINVLFVRMGKGDFLCCGTCKVCEGESPQTEGKDWGLVELHLQLQKWDTLQNCDDFVSMISLEPVNGASADNEKTNEGDVAAMVIEGNVVGAISEALNVSLVPSAERSIDKGVDLLKTILRTKDDQQAREALSILNTM